MKTRVISAIVALIIVVPLILLGGIYFEFGVCLLAALAYKEIVDLKKSHNELPPLMILFGLLGILFLVLSNNIAASIYRGFTYQILALIVVSLLVPTLFYKDKYTTKDAFYLIGNVLFLGLIFNIFIIIRFRGIKMFIFLLLIPIINDIFAYLVGRKFGKHKMCKDISPKKTWEGSVGGLVIGTIAASLFYHFVIGGLNLKMIIVILILSCAGQIGDLIMSKVKRENEIKDFSNIMPGHGGILDRLDSSIFVFLTYIFLMII